VSCHGQCVCGGDLPGQNFVLHGGGAFLGHLELAHGEGLALHLPLSLQGGYNVLVSSANLVFEPTQGAKFLAMLQAENLESRGDSIFLLLLP